MGPTENGRNGQNDGNDGNDKPLTRMPRMNANRSAYIHVAYRNEPN